MVNTVSSTGLNYNYIDAKYQAALSKMQKSLAASVESQEALASLQSKSQQLLASAPLPSYRKDTISGPNDEPTNYARIIKQGSSLRNGPQYEVQVSSVYNPAMMVIRYLPGNVPQISNDLEQTITNSESIIINGIEVNPAAKSMTLVELCQSINDLAGAKLYAEIRSVGDLHRLEISARDKVSEVTITNADSAITDVTADHISAGIDKEYQGLTCFASDVVCGLLERASTEVLVTSGPGNAQYNLITTDKNTIDIEGTCIEIDSSGKNQNFKLEIQSNIAQVIDHIIGAYNDVHGLLTEQQSNQVMLDKYGIISTMSNLKSELVSAGVDDVKLRGLGMGWQDGALVLKDPTLLLSATNSTAVTGFVEAIFTSINIAKAHLNKLYNSTKKRLDALEEQKQKQIDRIEYHIQWLEKIKLAQQQALQQIYAFFNEIKPFTLQNF